jgi:hypothetical protein
MMRTPEADGAERNDHRVSKSEFARIVGVAPGRVTQWIAAGQINGDALVGDGRSAQVRVAVAVEQLRERLDVGRRECASAKAKLDGIASVPARPVISEESLRRLAAKLAEAITQVLVREFMLERSAEEFTDPAEE